MNVTPSISTNYEQKAKNYANQNEPKQTQFKPNFLKIDNRNSEIENQKSTIYLSILSFAPQANQEVFPVRTEDKAVLQGLFERQHRGALL